jgi:hypothetical protein
MKVQRRWVHDLRLIAVAAVAVLALGGAIASSALAVEPTTGQPGATAGNHCGEGTSALTPGKSGTAPGAVGNPSGVSGTVYAGNPGTASLANANSTAAVSQYDVSCLQVTTHT